MAATPPPAAAPPPRLGNFVSPAAEKALFVAGHPGPLPTALRAALAAAFASTLPYLVHTVLPLCVPHSCPLSPSGATDSVCVCDACSQAAPSPAPPTPY